MDAGTSLKLNSAFLILAGATVSAIGLLYGVSPEWFASTFLSGAPQLTVDQAHVLRANMALYLGFGCFLLYCAFSAAHHAIGLVVFVIFCASLAAGRILSVLVDGMPSPIFIAYIVIEVAALPVPLWLLARNRRRADGKL
jgi:hypothetical protein